MPGTQQILQALVLPVPVGRVAHHREPQELEVHPDLVRAAGVQDRLDQRRPAQSLQHMVAGPRLTSSVVIHRHALAMGGMPSNGGADFAPVARQLAAEDRLVDLLHPAGGELGGKRQVRFVVLRHDQAAAGFLVQPMDDARAGDTADAAQPARAVVKQGVDERVFFVTSRRMHYQPRRLVQHQQRLVLIQDVEQHRFRLGFGGPGFRPVHFNLLAGPGRVRRLDDAAVDPDVALLDQALNRTPRDGRELAAQVGVEPLRGQRVFDGQDFRAGRHSKRSMTAAAHSSMVPPVGRRRFDRLGLMVGAPGDQEDQPHARADRAVRHIEGGKPDLSSVSLLHVEVNEINHMPRPQPVNQIPHDPAEDQPKGDLAEEGARVKVMPAKEQHQQRKQGDAGQQPVVAAE